MKHLAPESVGVLVQLFNRVVVEAIPPKSWRKLKMVALYKGKGNVMDANNYRGIAIMPPLAKLLMAMLCRRLEQEADRLDARAYTMAGFR